MDEEPHHYHVYDWVADYLSTDSEILSSEDSQSEFNQHDEPYSLQGDQETSEYNFYLDNHLGSNKIIGTSNNEDMSVESISDLEFRDNSQYPSEIRQESVPVPFMETSQKSLNGRDGRVQNRGATFTEEEIIEIENEDIDEVQVVMETRRQMESGTQQQSNSSLKINNDLTITKPSQRPGKRKDPIWALFTETEQNSTAASGAAITRKVQRCNACFLPVSAKAVRMKKHIVSGCLSKRNLPSKPPNNRITCESADRESSAVPIGPEERSQPGEDFLPIPVPSQQCKISSFVAKTTTSKAQKMDLDLRAPKFWYFL